MISICIVNFNEEKQLKLCLNSIADFADEIVVVDLGSTDQSKQLVERFKGKFLTHKIVEYVELVRNYAIEKTTGDWILVLDPDEQITPELKNKLKEIAKQGKYVAVNIPRKNIFFGKWIAHSNWWPDKQIRFFKKDKVKWNNTIHSYPSVKGAVYDLPAKKELAILHHGYETISQFMERQNRYSEIAARNLFDKNIKFSWGSFIWKPLREFLVRYIRHAGFLDGFAGLALTFLMMVYQLQVMINLHELERESK